MDLSSYSTKSLVCSWKYWDNKDIVKGSIYVKSVCTYLLVCDERNQTNHVLYTELHPLVTSNLQTVRSMCEAVSLIPRTAWMHRPCPGGSTTYEPLANNKVHSGPLPNTTSKDAWAPWLEIKPPTKMRVGNTADQKNTTEAQVSQQTQN